MKGKEEKEKEGGAKATLKMGKEKSWNYDDLIRKVRNNERFLMRNFLFFFSIHICAALQWPLRPSTGRESCCALLWVSFFPYIIQNQSRLKGRKKKAAEKILMKKEKWIEKKERIFHRQAVAVVAGEWKTLVDVLFNEGDSYFFSYFCSFPFPFAHCSFFFTH